VLTQALHRINPAVKVDYLLRDFCELSSQEIDRHLGQSDLLIFATDFFPAQARGNLEALRLKKPAVWIGLYREGRAGEIVYYVPGVTPACYRCVCSSRYHAFAAQARTPAANQNATHIPSTGGTIFDLRLVDAVAGPIIIGIFTAGADNRFGQLIKQLGNRNLLQVKMDPEYRLGQQDIFGQHLGPDHFAFNTIALPMDPEEGCPDCGGARQTHQERPCATSTVNTSRATPTAGRSRSTANS